MTDKAEVLEKIPLEYEKRVTSTTIADEIGEKKTNVRDTIQELREEGWPIGGGQGIRGYWLVQSADERELVVQNIDSNIQTLRERKREFLNNCGSPAVSYGEPATDGGRDVPEALRDAVDVLVQEHGVEYAESYLQEKFQDGDDQERVIAALGYLRQQYATDRGEVIAGP